MGTYLFGRATQLLLVMLLSSVILFFMLHILPGDPATVIAGQSATPDVVAKVRAQFGLDKPLVEQYTQWLGDLLHGDMGISLRGGRPASQRIKPAIMPTVELAVSSLLVALAVGVPLGIAAGARPRGAWDNLLTLFTAIALGVPGFVLGVVALLVLAVHVHWLPPGGRVAIWSDPGNAFKHLLLPAVTLGLSSAAVFARFVRSGVQSSLRDDYVRTALAKGLKYRLVVRRHALPNSLIPLITVVALQTGRLLGGAVITEQVFGWPGLGRLVVDSVQSRDYLVVQGVCVLFVGTFIVVNAVSDLLYAVVDPRVRT